MSEEWAGPSVGSEDDTGVSPRTFMLLTYLTATEKPDSAWSALPELSSYAFLPSLCAWLMQVPAFPGSSLDF